MIRRSEALAAIREAVANSKPEDIATIRRDYERHGDLGLHHMGAGISIRNLLRGVARDRGEELPRWFNPDEVWESLFLEVLGYDTPRWVPRSYRLPGEPEDPDRLVWDS